MSEKTNTGGAAFPGDDVNYGPRIGMSLRDYFAAQIAAGDAAGGDGWGESDRILASGLLGRARLYYRIADAMIAVRQEGKASD